MLCPICGPYLIRKRMHPIREIASGFQADEGLHHFLLTLSVQHDATTSWTAIHQAISQMWSSVQHLRPWRSGVIGSFRVLESTFGPNGHHLHEHIVVTVQEVPGWDAQNFFEKVEGACQRAVGKLGMTCAFRPGWWVSIPSADLLRVVAYFASAEKWGQIDRTGEEGHVPMWEMPAAAFAEAWRASKGVRWFGASGCWKHRKPVEERASHASEAPEEAEKVVFHFPAAIWGAWSPAERRERLALIHDARVPHLALVEAALHWGARLGPPEPS
jgi:hypothetical protein